MNHVRWWRRERTIIRLHVADEHEEAIDYGYPRLEDFAVLWVVAPPEGPKGANKPYNYPQLRRHRAMLLLQAEHKGPECKDNGNCGLRGEGYYDLGGK